MLIVSPIFLRLFTGGFASAISLWPFIILKTQDQKWDKVTLNHERIHLRQQLELFVLPFYFIYLVHYLLLRFNGLSKHSAYLNICFEREAYLYESQSHYLQTRRAYSFLYFCYNT